MNLHEVKTKSGAVLRGKIRVFQIQGVPMLEICALMPASEVESQKPLKAVPEGYWVGDFGPLILAASDFYAVSMEDMMSKKRPTHICIARWACWQVMKCNGMVYEEIGKRFGKDHGTVLNGVRSFYQLLLQNAVEKTRFEMFLNSQGLNSHFYTVKLS